MTVAANDPETSTINQGLIGFNHVTAGAGPALTAIGSQWARTDVSFEPSFDSARVYNCTTGVWSPALLDSNVAADRQAGANPPSPVRRVIGQIGPSGA